MKLLAYPKDNNPYQELLYAQMRRQGACVHYIGQLTSSHTANLALLPLEILALRLKGWRIIHLHWVFPFLFTGGARFTWLRWLSQAWFYLFLTVAAAIGMQLAWTAHNVLPHEQVFYSDLAARRRLGRASSVVFAHAASVFDELATLGISAQTTIVIPHGPFVAPDAVCRTALPRSRRDHLELLFFGRIAEYKGVEDLLAAVATLPSSTPIRLTVAGACGDPVLRQRLREQCAAQSDRVSLRLGHVPDSDVPDLLQQADIVALPFRQITTSGSALLALSYGRPVIVPDVPTLRHLPARATIRYDGSAESLAATLTAVSQLSAEQLAQMATGAQDFCAANSWQRAAQISLAALERIGVYPPRTIDMETPSSTSAIHWQRIAVDDKGVWTGRMEPWTS